MLFLQDHFNCRNHYYSTRSTICKSMKTDIFCYFIVLFYLFHILRSPSRVTSVNVVWAPNWQLTPASYIFFSVGLYDSLQLSPGIVIVIDTYKA